MYSSISEKYPSIMNWFEDKKDKLADRTDKGEYWWELRPCSYNEEFEKDKIVWAETSSGNQFCLIAKGTYLNKTSFFMPGNDLTLLAILNSNLVKFYLNSIVSKVRGGYFSMSKAYVETIPISYPKDQKPFIKLVDKILSLKKSNPEADTSDLEAEIDMLVYELYGLSEEEIAVIEK